VRCLRMLLIVFACFPVLLLAVFEGAALAQEAAVVAGAPFLADAQLAEKAPGVLDLVLRAPQRREDVSWHLVYRLPRESFYGNPASLCVQARALRWLL